MKRKKLVYLDYESTKELSETMPRADFIKFLEKNTIISIDNEGYYYLMEFRQKTRLLGSGSKRIKE